MRRDSTGSSHGKRSALSDEVADHVRGMVMTGQVREGDYLRLDRLAAKLDMSVTPVREGLLTLQGEGFVELVPRRGFAVRAISSQDVEDIFWVQAQIEGEIARRAAGHFGTRGVETLQAIQTALEEAAADSDRELVERLNYDFHHSIARVVDSSRLRWFLKQAAQLSPSRFPQVEGWAQAAVDDHSAIVAALGAGDAAAAAASMTEHVMHAGRLLVAQAAEARERALELDVEGAV